MRMLRRPSISLPTLRRGGSARSTAARLLAQYRTVLSVPRARDFQDHWKESDVRGALLAMHGHICAWCQCDLQVFPGDVEHFRPKSLYWWLAYDFGNYLLSCSNCNRRKGVSFPLLGDWQCTWSDRKRLHEEFLLLLDPTVDDVESCFCVRYQNRYFRLNPLESLGLDSVQRRRAETTLSLFKWNENPKLIIERKKVIREALQAARKAAQGNRRETVRVKNRASRFSPYGIAIRQLLQKKYPDLIPTPTEELLFFVGHLAGQLSLTEDLLRKNAGNTIAQRHQSEILWALAVLWKDPPHVSPSEIERWLERFGCREQVSAVLARL
jgi:uncharacterized protein (TIGR02646 family)